MTDARITYDAAAALALLPPERIAELNAPLTAARDEVLNDVELWQSGGAIPPEKDPLDAGFIQWPEELLQDLNENGADSLVARIEAAAKRIQAAADNVVVLGIGGSYMGMKAMFESLCDRFHNERTRDQRSGIPRIYFEGWNVDSDCQSDLLDLLQDRATNFQNAEGRTAVIVISKSGGTMETAVAFRIFRDFMARNFPEELKELIVPVTGDVGKLRTLSDNAGYQDVFSIPDGIGGRFSVLTAVGLLPAAVAGLNIRELLRGAAAAADSFRRDAYEENLVLQYTAVCHAFEHDHGMSQRLLSTWGARLESVGFWYDQLLSESLGKHERGATPLTVVNTRDLHSRGQQHQEGRRDKLITNLTSGSTVRPVMTLPSADDDADQLNQFAGTPLDSILDAALQGTNKAYADVKRPTTNLSMPTLNEFSVGELFQILMLATVAEGRLVGTNPYGQPGVEDYKRNMKQILTDRVS